MNSFLLFIAGLLVLALSALFAVPYFVDWNEYRDVFEAQASKLIGRQVDVGGNVSLTLLPAPVLKFETVNVADAKGEFDTPFAAAKSVTVWLSVPPLLTGSVEARSVELVQPVVNLRINDDGTGNWADLGGEAAELPFIPEEVALNSVKISGATVNIWRGKPEPNSVIDNLDGELSARSLQGPYKFSGNFTFDGKQKELRFSTGKPEENGEIRLKASIRNPEAKESYSIDGTVRGLGDVPVFKGDFRARLADDASVAEVKKAGEKDNMQAAAPFEIKSVLFGRLTGAQFNEFELTMTRNDKPQTVTGLLDVQFDQGIVVGGTFSSRWVNIDSWFGPKSEEPPKLQEALATLASELLERASPVREGKLRLFLDQVVFAGDLASSVDVTLDVKDEKLVLSKLAARLPGDNRVKLEGVLTRDASGPRFSGPISFSGQSLSRVMRWAGFEGEPNAATQAGEFAVEGKLTAGVQEVALADAKGNLFGSAFDGSFSYRGGGDNKLSVTLQSERLDLARMLGTKASARSLFSLLVPQSGGPSGDGTDEKTEDGVLGGIRAEADVSVEAMTLTGLGESALEIKLVRDKDTIDIRRLFIASKGDVNIQAGGRLAGLSNRPQGNLTFAVQVASGAGVKSLSEFLEVPGLATSPVDRLAALTPLQVTASVRSASQEKLGLDAQLEGALSDSDLALKVSLEGKPSEWHSAQLDLKGTMTNRSGAKLIQQLRPTLEQSDLTAFGAGGGDLSIEASGIAKSGLQTKVVVNAGGASWVTQGTYKTNEADSGFLGTSQLTSNNTAAGLALLGIRTAPGYGVEPVSLSASVTGGQGVYRLTHVNGKLAGTSMSGELMADLSGKKPKIDAIIGAPEASLPRLLAPMISWQDTGANPQDIRGVTRSEAFWPDAPFDTAFLERANGTLSLSSDRLQLGGGLKLQKASMQATLSGGTVRVGSLEGELFGGAFKANGELASRGSGASLDMRVETSGMRADQMIVTSDGSPLLDAPIDITMSLSGEGLTPRGLVSGLRGTGRLRVGDGQVSGFSLGAAHVAATSAKKERAESNGGEDDLGRQIAENLKSAEMAFTPIKAPFTVSNGVVEFEKLALSDSEGRVTIATYLQLANLQLDSEWALQSAATGGGTNPRVSLIFSGSLTDMSKLQPKIDTTGLARYVTIRKMEKDVERLEKLDVSRPGARIEPAPPPAPQPEVQAQAPQAIQPEETKKVETKPPPARPLPSPKRTTERLSAMPSAQPAPVGVPEPDRKPKVSAAAATAAPASELPPPPDEPPAAAAAEPPAGALPPPVQPIIPGRAEPTLAEPAPSQATEQPAAAPQAPQKPEVAVAPPRPPQPAPLPARKPPKPTAAPAAAPAPARAPPSAAVRSSPAPAPAPPGPDLPWLQSATPPAGSPPAPPASEPNAPTQLPVPPPATAAPDQPQTAPPPVHSQPRDFNPFAESAN
jgi:uncharacterized protein involved in outer membrane biogenesis